MEAGKVYAFVGVIGGGKSYRLNQIKKQAEAEGRTVIIADFSDGIRQTLMNIFTGSDQPIDLNSYDYEAWKAIEQELFLPIAECETGAKVTIKGRDMLTRTAEYIKKLAGVDVWAKYTQRSVLKQWCELNTPHGLGDMTTWEKKQDAVILFGSVRFPWEAGVVYEIARTFKKETEITFCDYHSDRYAITDHVSERLAQELLRRGFKDGDRLDTTLQEFAKGDGWMRFIH